MFTPKPDDAIAEIGGAALVRELAADVGPIMWIPIAAFAVWVLVWRVKFRPGDVAGLLGRFLIVFIVSVFVLQPNWGEAVDQAVTPVTAPVGPARYSMTAVIPSASSTTSS